MSGSPRPPQLTGLVLALLGLLVLFGWANGLPILTRVGQGLPHMMPNTAMGMIALGAGLLSWDSTGRGARHLMVAAGVAAAALGSATIWEYLTGVDLGIDLLLFADRTAVAPHPGRMALATALSFSLAGFGLLLLRRPARGAILIGQTMALGVVVLALSSVLAYLFGAQPPDRLGVFSTMAVHTSLGLLAAGMAMLLLRPTSGLMAAVLGDELGATVLRKLLPGVLLLPAIIAYFRLVGHHTGWYGAEFALALYVTAQIGVLTAGLWLVSRWLSRTDRKRREVEGVNRRLIDELTNARSALEATVAQRTSELVQSEAKFRRLLALSSDWYWEQDENLRFTFVSNGNEAQSALPAVDSLGKSSFELEIDWAPGQREQHEATLHARQPFRDLELRRVSPDGREVFLSMSGEPVFGRDAQFMGYRGVGRDVTAEERAERNRQLLASIVEHTHDAVISRSLDGTILSWNKAAERIYGYRSEEVMGRNAAFLFGEDGDQVLEEINRRVLAGEQGFESPAARRSKSGASVDLAVSISPLKDALGRLVGVTSIARDVSALVRALSALQESDRRLSLALSIAGVETWEVDLSTGAIRSSEGLGPIFGRERGFQFNDRLAWRDAIHPRDRQRVAELFDAAALGKVGYDVEYAVLRDHSSEGWVTSRCVFERDAQGYALRAIGMLMDLTERHRFEQQLHAEKELAQVTLRSIGDAVITTDADGRVNYLNPTAEQLTGWVLEQAVGRPVSDVFRVVAEAERIPMSNPLDRVLAEGRNIEVGEEALLLSRDGGEYSIADSAAPIRSREGDVVGAVLVFHDVTSERRIAQELRFQAAHDALTGLINRREFEVRVEQALGRARVDGAEHALCYIDLDQFKVVNDACGHAAGDDLLRQVADLLRAQLRQHDTLARLGGDEFGLLLENCPKEMAARITEKVLLAVHERRFRWRDQVFRLGASIGVAVLSDPHQTLAQAFSAADSACYAAKEMGRNRVHFFRSGDEALARRIGEMSWVSRLHGALEEDRFVLFAQPVLALKRSGRSRRTYCEVLTRLREPDGTLTEPGAFIPAAERYGLMPRIDQWVVRRVLEQLADARVQADATVTYGINLSALSLTQEGMLDWFKALLRAHSLAPQNLCLEITETAAISNLALAQQFIAELKLLGCAFALDDFGSGMSSFTHLRHLGVDYLKIDGSFVVGAVNEPVDRAMIDAINRVGHTMGIQTIAEWVENEAALDMLRELDVDYAQGFAVAHPRPLEEVVLRGVRAIAPVASGRRDSQVY